MPMLPRGRFLPTRLISVSNWSNMVLALALAPAAFAAGPSSSLVPAGDRSGFATNLTVRFWARVKLGYTHE
jgi:hypothetical protein